MAPIAGYQYQAVGDGNFFLTDFYRQLFLIVTDQIFRKKERYCHDQFKSYRLFFR